MNIADKVASITPMMIIFDACNQCKWKIDPVTVIIWECAVVRPESQDGQISKFTGQMQWPSGKPGGTVDKSVKTQKKRQQFWVDTE